MSFIWKLNNNPLHPQLTFLEEQLSDVASMKILGVTLDAKLISNLAMTTSRKLGMIRKAKWNNLNSSTTATINKSFIRPNLEYCSPIWSTVAQPGVL